MLTILHHKVYNFNLSGVNCSIFPDIMLSSLDFLWLFLLEVMWKFYAALEGIFIYLSDEYQWIPSYWRKCSVLFAESNQGESVSSLCCPLGSVYPTLVPFSWDSEMAKHFSFMFMVIARCYRKTSWLSYSTCPTAQHLQVGYLCNSSYYIVLLGCLYSLNMATCLHSRLRCQCVVFIKK